MEDFINLEYKNWKQLGDVLSELNQLVMNKRKVDDKFYNVVKKLNLITSNNIFSI